MVRRSESPDPDIPVKWSQWIREKVDIALNADVIQSVAVDTSSVEVQDSRERMMILKSGWQHSKAERSVCHSIA